MLGAAPLMAFVPSTDLDRSRAFYEGVLGLTFVEVTPFACVFQAAGTTLRVAKVNELTPQPFTVLGWLVPEIDKTIDALTAAGVTFTRYDGMSQDERGIWTAPGGAKIAWFPDPDGNNLSLTELG